MKKRILLWALPLALFCTQVCQAAVAGQAPAADAMDVVEIASGSLLIAVGAFGTGMMLSALIPFGAELFAHVITTMVSVALIGALVLSLLMLGVGLFMLIRAVRRMRGKGLGRGFRRFRKRESWDGF